VKIEIGRRARIQVQRASDWWHENADYPLYFDQEFEAALLRLLRTPRAGSPYPTSKRPHLMRLLLLKTEYHIYYSLEQDETRVVIHSVWGARRARTPKL
jgi:plasmid stabilization system protein ParE